MITLLTRRHISLTIALSLLLVAWVLFGFAALIFGFSSTEIVHDFGNLGLTSVKKLPFGAIFGDSGELQGSSLRVCHDSDLKLAWTTYVVSLPTREDRRESMEKLRSALSLRWTYVDAIPSDDTIIGTIISNLVSFRRSQTELSSRYNDTLQFAWPSNFSHSLATYNGSITYRQELDVDQLSSPKVYEEVSAISMTASSNSDPPVAPATSSLSPGHYPASQGSFDPDTIPITCATNNSIFGIPYSPDLPKQMLLTAAKVACWYSHLQVIHRIASEVPFLATSDSACSNVTLILEDDVDMELDIKKRLVGIWNSLPQDWDILFLGHCWSNESHFPGVPLKPEILPTTDLRVNDSHPFLLEVKNTVHPSYSPKCTHAYALSPSGARKILQYLTYPPFAYSRALDQALSWLILSERIKSYSVVPSLIIQRKVLSSDVDAGKSGLGSSWRDGLENGVLAMLESSQLAG